MKIDRLSKVALAGSAMNRFIIMLLSLVSMTAGCCTKRMVDRPYPDVRAALDTMEHQINSARRQPADAKAEGQYIFGSYRLYIVEEPNRIFQPFTWLTAKNLGTNATLLEVVSRQEGLLINQRRPETEERRLNQLLEILH